VRAQQIEIEQVRNPQAAAAHFIFVSGADSPGSGADLYPAGRIFRRQFNHAMVGQDHMSPVADEQAAIDLDAGLAQGGNFLQQRHWIENDTVPNYAATAGPQNSAGNKLQNEFFAVDNDGVSGVMAAGIAGYDGEVFRKNIDNFAFALVAPLRTYDDRGLTLLQKQTPWYEMAAARPHSRVAHTLCPRRLLHNELQGKIGLMCTGNDNLPDCGWAIVGAVFGRQSSKPWIEARLKTDARRL
jgi:hypothetical protein